MRSSSLPISNGDVAVNSDNSVESSSSCVRVMVDIN